MTSSRYWRCTGLDENGDELSFVIKYPENVTLEEGQIYSLCPIKGNYMCLVFTAIDVDKGFIEDTIATSNDVALVTEGIYSALNGKIIPAEVINYFYLPQKSEMCKSNEYNYIEIRSYCRRYFPLKIPYNSRTEDSSTLLEGNLYNFNFGNPDYDGVYIVVGPGFEVWSEIELEIKNPIRITSVNEDEVEVCENYKFRRCDGDSYIISGNVNFGVDENNNLVLPTVGKHYHIYWTDYDGETTTICVEYLGNVNEIATTDIVSCADDPAIPFDDCCDEPTQTLDFEDCLTHEHYYWPQSFFLTASDFTENVSYTLGIYTKKCYTYRGVSDHEPNNPYIMNKANEKLCIDCDTYFRLYDVYSCYDNEKFDVPVIISGQILTELESLHNSSLTFEYNGVEYKCVTYGNYVQIDENEYEEFMSREHILIDDSVTTYKDCKECIDSIVDEGNEGVWTITGCDGETNILVIGTAEYESYDGCIVLFSVDGKAPKCGTINSVDITSSIPGYDNVSASRIDIEGSYKNCQKCHDDNCNEEDEKNEVLGFTPDNSYSVNATYDSCIKYDVCCEDKNKDL